MPKNHYWVPFPLGIWNSQSRLSLQPTRGLGHGLRGGATSGAPHGLHADLVISFLSDLYIEYSTREQIPVRVREEIWPFLARESNPSERILWDSIPCQHHSQCLHCDPLSLSALGDQLWWIHILITI